MANKDTFFAELILGNANKNFSGVTSTMLQVLPHQQKTMDLVVLGDSNLPEGIPYLSFFALIRKLKQLNSSIPHVFHARRNLEMIQALILKYLFRLNLKIVFTSTAQRDKTWLTRFLMKQMDGLLSTCTAAATYMPDPPDQLIPHGINLDDFKQCEDKQSLLKELGISGKQAVAIFGRVRHQKGVDNFIDMALELAPQFPDTVFIIIGETLDNQQSFLAEQQKKISLQECEQQIIFTGKLSFKDLQHFMRAVSVTCAFSRNEGYGLTVLEAMASGTPVVATKAGAWPDIIENGKDGFLLDIADSKAMVEKVSLLLRDKNLQDKFIDAAYRKVKAQYSASNEASGLVDYYRHIQSADSDNAD